MDNSQKLKKPSLDQEKLILEVLHMLLAAMEKWEADDQFLFDRGSMVPGDVSKSTLSDRNNLKKALQDKKISEAECKTEVELDDLQEIFRGLKKIVSEYEIPVLSAAKIEEIKQRVRGIIFGVPLEEPSFEIKQRIFEILTNLKIEAEAPSKPIEAPEIPKGDPGTPNPENVPGKYFITNECIDCDLCRETAPRNMCRSDAKQYSYVYKQPSNEEEDNQCKQAFKGCPVQAVGVRA